MGSRFVGAHGLTLVEESDEEYLWLTDQDSAEVAKMTLDGETVTTLDTPQHDASQDGDYVPTWVAVNGAHHGGDGDIWVADGYGESLVHRYGADGGYHEAIDGTEGVSRFDCPHAVSISHRGDVPELYIADRGNERVQVYRVDGTFKRSFGADVLTSPCAFDTDDGELVIPELSARVTLSDADGEVITHVGANEAVVGRNDWPNVPDDRIDPGRFNSPHDAAFDADGNLYVVEWLVGGRITKLARV